MVKKYSDGVDIVIPVYKPDEKFDRLLEWLGKQTVISRKELLRLRI